MNVAVRSPQSPHPHKADGAACDNTISIPRKGQKLGSGQPRNREWENQSPRVASRGEPALTAWNGLYTPVTQKSQSGPVSRVLSRAAISLGRRLPAASSDRPGSRYGPDESAARRAVLPAWSCSRWGLPSQAGHPICWCALTAPFHPYPWQPRSQDRAAASAVYFLLHFPGPCGRWALPTTVSCGARTFLSGAQRARSGRLARSGNYLFYACRSAGLSRPTSRRRVCRESVEPPAARSNANAVASRLTETQYSMVLRLFPANSDDEDEFSAAQQPARIDPASFNR